MQLPLRTPARSFLPLLGVIVSLLVAGCASDPGPGHKGSRRPPLPTLTGQQTYFAGAITADIRVGAMAGFKPDADPKDPAGSGRPRRSGFSGGMGDGPRRERGEHGEGGERPAGGTKRGPGSAAPPVTIHLRFTNHGTEPVDLAIVDFLSPLGNFVVYPATLRLDPGQSAEVEPMTSRLAGEVSSGEISLALGLAGAKEIRTITLQVENQPGPESGKSGQAL